MLRTIKNFTHHADIHEGTLRVIPSKGGKSWLIVAANGQAIAETVPTQNPQKGMARAALLAHALNCFPDLHGKVGALVYFNAANPHKSLHWENLVKTHLKSEDLSNIGV